MAFWWSMLVCNLLMPVIMIVVGIIMMKRPPKKINAFVGYRTSRSMDNQESWNFANKHSGKLMIMFGIIAIIPSVVIMLPFYGSDDDTIGMISTVIMVFQFILIIIPIILTERILKRKVKEENIE